LSQWCPVAEYSDRSGNELKVILRTRHRRAHCVLCGRPASAAGPRVTRSDVGFWGRRPFDSPWWRAIDHRQPYRWARFDGDADGVAEGRVHPGIVSRRTSRRRSW
jgi:hypothetical protein